MYSNVLTYFLHIFSIPCVYRLTERMGRHVGAEYNVPLRIPASWSVRFQLPAHVHPVRQQMMPKDLWEAQAEILAPGLSLG